MRNLKSGYSQDLTSRGHNNFGAIRLVFAIAVIFGHTPQLLYATDLEDPLRMILGVLPLGDIAVDGFFIISGYLVTASALTSGSARNYLVKRVMRIYPGFIIASLVCLLIVAPLAGAAPFQHNPVLDFFRTALLQQPQAEGAFLGLRYPELDAPMWTIPEEFLCYLLVLVAAFSGIPDRLFRGFDHRKLLVACTIVLLTILAARLRVDTRAWTIGFGGDHQNIVRFVGTFCIGACFYLWRNSIPITGTIACFCFIVLIICLHNWWLAEPAFAILGGYCIFWLASKPIAGWVSRVGVRVDLSYGIYLYAWPVQALLIWRWKFVSSSVISLITLAVAAAIAYLSWTLVEKPALRMAKRLLAQRSERLSDLSLTVDGGNVAARPR